MDCRTVLTCLCLLIAQAACRPAKGPLNLTAQDMREEIRVALQILLQAESGVLPNTSCSPLNITELVGPEQQPITAHQLSIFRCLMMKMSELKSNLSVQLRKIIQYSQSMERVASGHSPSHCILRPLEQEMYNYVCAKHLLQLLDQRLSKANF